MDKKHFQDWQQDKAKEMFALSHKLMETAKQLGEHHAAELKAGMEHAVAFAKNAATNDINKLKALQEQAAKDATVRMNAYQKKVKSLLKDIGEEAADEAEKHLEKARTALSDWLDQTGKKMPVGGAEISKVVRDVTDAGAKVFKEGRKMVNDAVEAAEKNIEDLSKKASSGTKSAAARTPVKRAPAKKATRKTAAKKTTRR